MWRVLTTFLLALLSVAVPVTFQPDLPFLLTLWALVFLCFVGIVLTSPPVASRIWQAAAVRVAPHLPKPSEPGVLKTLLAEKQLEAVQENAQSDLRVALAQIAEELEYALPIIKDRDHNFFRTARSIPMRRWDEHGATLAASRADLHRCAREAYQRIDELNRNLDVVQVGPMEAHQRINDARAEVATPAISRALEALEEAQP